MFKATSLFGGVQVFNILISVIRAKFVAVFLGTAGVGILSLLQSISTLIGSLTQMGINVSAVRDISAASGTGDHYKVSRTITVFRKLIWFTGLLGTVSMIVLSPWLSRWTFGNSDYTLAFIWLSGTLFLGAISSGQISLLHGLQKLKQMAKASMWGSAIGLVISLPLYYFFGEKGIVPTLIVSSVIALVLSWFFSRKIQLEKIKVTLMESFAEGKDMAKMGILMTMSGFTNMFASYLVNAFISRSGGVADVGLFQAGWNITNKYVGLVFTAMVTDYFPRLSKVSDDLKKIKDVLNQQAELALLILGPILIILLSTTPFVIHILYTKEFLPVVSYIQWVIFGVLFSAGAWCMGFIFMAKGDSKLYFWKELISSIVILVSNITGYYLGGLEGLGISYTIGNIIIFFFVSWLCFYKYKITLGFEFRKILSIELALCIIAFTLAYKLGFPYAYFTGGILFLIMLGYSLFELDKRLNIKQFVFSKIKKD
jgi:O-antigen/teichoic acid export membrane protein